jgi:hypothetical protein
MDTDQIDEYAELHTVSDYVTQLKYIKDHLDRNVLLQNFYIEHPQVIALFFAIVDDSNLFEWFIDMCPKRLQTDVMLRFKSMESHVSKIPLEALVKVTGKWLITDDQTFATNTENNLAVDAIIRNRIGILQGIEEVDPDLADEISGYQLTEISKQKREHQRSLANIANLEESKRRSNGTISDLEDEIEQLKNENKKLNNKSSIFVEDNMPTDDEQQDLDEKFVKYNENTLREEA